MQISMWVPYDENQLRRTIRFVLQPQIRTVRILGLVILVLGVLLVAMNPMNVSSYIPPIVGLFFIVAVGPITVGRTVRMQTDLLKQGQHLTLDSESVTVTYPLVESRFKWAGVVRVVETPDVWYVMFGKVQSLTIPKGPMTDQQRMEFGAFVAGLTPLSASAVG